jgi:hypothetical protein
MWDLSVRCLCGVFACICVSQVQSHIMRGLLEYIERERQGERVGSGWVGWDKMGWCGMVHVSDPDRHNRCTAELPLLSSHGTGEAGLSAMRSASMVAHWGGSRLMRCVSLASPTTTPPTRHPSQPGLLGGGGPCGR